MQRLHLVGFTTDLDGLIFSARKGAKSGGFLVPLDDQLLGSIAEAARIRNGESTGGKTKSGGGGEQQRGDRPTNSLLTPRQIQARLRAGQSITEVAAEAKVDTEWVERFAVPVVAEQARMVSQARSSTYSKARLGQSIQDLATSVRWNLADKGVILAADIFDESWSAFQMQDDIWMVRFRYTSRGREQLAEWEFDAGNHHLVSRNRLASELGYVEKGRRRRPMVPPPAPPAAPALPPVVRPVVDIVVVEEPEPETPPRPARRTSAKKGARRRPSARKAAKRAAPKKTAKKATTKKTTRKTAIKKATTKKTTRKTAIKKTTGKKTTGKKTAPRAKKTTARKSATRKSATRKSATRKTTARKTTAKRTTTRRAAPRAAARKAPARRAPATRVTAGRAKTPAAPKKAPVRRTLAVSRAGTRPQPRKRLPETPPPAAPAPSRSQEPAAAGPLTRSLLARRLAARSSGTPRVAGERAGGPVGKKVRPLRPSR